MSFWLMWCSWCYFIWSKYKGRLLCVVRAVATSSVRGLVRAIDINSFFLNQYPAWWHDRQDCRKCFEKHDLVSNFSHQHSVEPAAKCVHWIGEAQQQTHWAQKCSDYIIWIGGLAHFQKRTWDVGCMVWCHSAIWTKTDLGWFKSFCARHTWCRWIWLYAYIGVGWGACCRIPRWMVMVLSLCLACVNVEIRFSNKFKTVRVTVLKYHYAEKISVFKFLHVQPWLWPMSH